MWVSWRRCVRPSLSVSRFASYHTNNALFSKKNPAMKRLRTESTKSLPKTVLDLDERVSSELKKLSLDDDRRTSKKGVTIEHKTSVVSLSDHYEFVFGISPCLLAITQGRRKILRLYVKEGDTSLRASVLKVCEDAHRHGLPIHHVSKKDIDKMAPGRVHQGVCLQASPLTYVTKEKQGESLLLARKDKNMPLWLVLESVQDPMNLGAILRSAYFLGVDRVVSSISQSCPLSPVVSKASSGVMEVMEVYGCKNLGELLHLKKAQGWDVVGTVGAESRQSCVTKCLDFTMSKPTLLLIGGEGGGLSQELQTYCQTLLTIPAGRSLSPGIESLNVSVATGILLHSLLFSRCSNKPM
ncbi:rRNA methyltransferase 1, mitochondrial [Eucyclogobius newberryi]|uniref:rRNA methyltransferase 1, mitochondrial n=1 Tax=Eucyclogobius newberryi TaxID=166745 RepID=UPI003B5B0BE4